MAPPYRNVYFDIAGVCNAQCPYCLSGRFRVPGGKYITTELFEQIIRKLIEYKLVDKDSVVGLYNWGEPFIHPHLHDVIEVANRCEISYSFSTNVSKVPKIDPLF